MTIQKPFAVGEKVKGTYYGKPYTGTVTHARAHTMNQSYKHYVELDEAIEAFGDIRERIIVNIWDGKEENTIQGVAA